MMLYYLIEGFDLRWPVRSCVSLGISFSIGLLSYYSMYGWLLMGAVFCVLAVMTDPELPDKGSFIFRRAGLIFGICALLAGWFFVRNAFLRSGDFLGINAELISRARCRSRDKFCTDISVIGMMACPPCSFCDLRIMNGSE